MNFRRLQLSPCSSRASFSLIPFCIVNGCIVKNKYSIPATGLNGEEDGRKAHIRGDHIPLHIEAVPRRATGFFPCSRFSIVHFNFQQSSNSTVNHSNSASASTGDHSFRSDGGLSSSAGPTRSSMPQSSHIITRHAPYQLPYHHRGGRMHHRGSGHPRGEPAPKKTTGIPRDRLITVPKHIPGAFKDQTGASVVPLQLA